jgi:thioredoxin 1
MVKELNDKNFHETLGSDTPVLVDFWAAWCGPCRMMAPIFNELDSEYGDKLNFAKLNVDDEGALASEFAIQGIPTFILFKNGKEIDRFSGGGSKAMIKEKIDAMLGKA